MTAARLKRLRGWEETFSAHFLTAKKSNLLFEEASPLWPWSSISFLYTSLITLKFVWSMSAWYDIVNRRCLSPMVFSFIFSPHVRVDLRLSVPATRATEPDSLHFLFLFPGSSAIQPRDDVCENLNFARLACLLLGLYTVGIRSRVTLPGTLACSSATWLLRSTVHWSRTQTVNFAISNSCFTSYVDWNRRSFEWRILKSRFFSVR